MSTGLSEGLVVEGVLAVFGAKHLQPFLIEGGGDKTVDFLRSTVDGNRDAHFDSIGLRVSIIEDDGFVSALADSLFPLCGNYYSYASKASLRGQVSRLESGGNCNFVLSNISCAVISDYEGGAVIIKL